MGKRTPIRKKETPSREISDAASTPIRSTRKNKSRKSSQSDINGTKQRQRSKSPSKTPRKQQEEKDLMADLGNDIDGDLELEDEKKEPNPDALMPYSDFYEVDYTTIPNFFKTL